MDENKRNDEFSSADKVIADLEKTIEELRAAAKPEWLRVARVMHDYSLSRGKIYQLISTRKIESACLNDGSGCGRGVRLIRRRSIEAFVQSCTTPPIHERANQKNNNERKNNTR